MTIGAAQYSLTKSLTNYLGVRFVVGPNMLKRKKRIPKNKQKIMISGAFSVKGKISCNSFRTIMDGPL